MDLSSKDGKQQHGSALMAIMQVMNEAAANNEKPSFLEIFKRAYARQHQIQEHLKSLPHDNRNSEDR